MIYDSTFLQKETTKEIKQTILNSLSKFKLAEQIKLADELADDLMDFYQLLVDNKNFVKTLKDSTKPKKYKTTILFDIFSGKVNDFSLSIFNTIVESKWASENDLLMNVRHLSHFICFENAKIEGDLNKVLDEVVSIYPIFVGSKELSFLISNKNIKDKEKIFLVEKLISKKHSKITFSLFKNIFTKGFQDYFSDLASLITSVSVFENKKIAEVSTTIKFKKDQQVSLVSKLNKLFGSVMPIYFINPELIGGVVVRIDDQIIDSSVLRKVKLMQSVLQ